MCAKQQWEEKEQKVSAEYRRLERRIEEAEDTGADEMTALLFRKAAEHYKTLEVRDEEIKSAEMRETLAGREEIKEFDEELYRKLVKQIIVYKDDSAEVVFSNNNRVKIGYGDL